MNLLVRPMILFGRTGMVQTTPIPETLEIFKKFNSGAAGILASNALVLPFLETGFDEVAHLVFEDPSITSWLEYCEILEVGRDIAHAPSSKSVSAVEADSYPQSSWIGYVLGRETLFDQEPAFGRKMLMVFFAKGISDRDKDWLTQKIERELGTNSRAPWHGREFTAWCFVDGSRAKQIATQLRGLLSRRSIADYLIVEPISVRLSDISGLSPLADWVETGYRTNILAANDARSRTKTISVELRRPRRLKKIGKL